MLPVTAGIQPVPQGVLPAAHDCRRKMSAGLGDVESPPLPGRVESGKRGSRALESARGARRRMSAEVYIVMDWVGEWS